MVLRIRKTTTQITIGLVVAGIGVPIFLLLAHAPMARALTTSSWVSAEPTGRVRADISVSPSDNPAECTHQKVLIGNVTTQTDDICVYQADGFCYGVLNKWISQGWSGYNDASFLIGFPRDSRMYRVQGISINNLVRVPNSKHIVYRNFLPSSSWGSYLYVIKDVRSKLIKITNNDLSVGYTLANNAAEPLIKNEVGDPVMMRSTGASNNGRWLAVEMRPGGLVRVDMATFEFKWFSVYQPQYGIGMDADIEFSVSDDGERIATLGRNVDPRVAELRGSCGIDATRFQNEWRSNYVAILSHPCPEREVWSIISETRGGDLRFATHPSFNFDSNELTLWTTPYDRAGIVFKEKWVTITAAGYQPSHLNYLALGDSYSSGEGDTTVNPVTKQKYYLDHTDVDGGPTIPREKCHISGRSYPFLLRDGMHIGQDTMQSVACSGAEVANDYTGNDVGYMGQDKRLEVLKDKNKEENYRTIAKEEFIPGRIQQIQFVDKYKPKVITLTGGGNDVGFSDILKACAVSADVCDYANSSKELSMLGYEIQGQYDKLADLYTRLHDSSRHTKIYVVGYPQFISDVKKDCAWNVRLDKQERTFVRRTTSYLNDVIEAAAHRAGVKYIDIEDAFEQSNESHTLCGDGEAYVNGVNLNCAGGILTPLRIFAGSDECVESYHPISKGHAAMAATINAQVSDNIMTYTHCDADQSVCPVETQNPTPPDYFAWAMDLGAQHTQTQYTKIAIRDYAQKHNANATLAIQVSDLAPLSLAKVEIHSAPTQIGDFGVNDNGELIVDVGVPASIPAGYHTLHIIAKTFSGHAIDMWQIIQILGVAGDIDENGVADNQQHCLFVPASGNDSDGDAVDDACDLVIGESSRPLDAAVNAQGKTITYTREGDPVRFGKMSRMDPPKDDQRYKTAKSNNDDYSNTPSAIVSVIVALGVVGLLAATVAILRYKQRRKTFN